MENNEKAYYEKVDIDNELKLRKQLAALPPVSYTHLTLPTN